MTETLTFRPVGTTYHVRLLQAPEKSEGGIYLPESYRDCFTEAAVLAAGPGQRFDSPDEQNVRTVMWAGVGDHVLFEKHSFVPISRDGREGHVKDEELVAVSRDSEDLEPLNDWVRVRLLPAEQPSAVIEMPEFYRRASRRGVVEDVGPGRLRLVGKLAGKRVPVIRELGLKKRKDLIGQTVQWGEKAKVLDIGGRELECTLVRAEDILGIVENEVG